MNRWGLLSLGNVLASRGPAARMGGSLYQRLARLARRQQKLQGPSLIRVAKTVKQKKVNFGSLRSSILRTVSLPSAATKLVELRIPNIGSNLGN